MKKAALLILLLSSATWTSCSLASKEDSSDVDQSKIQVDLALTYYEDDNAGCAIASFMVDEKGKRFMMLRLDDKSNVTINGKPMKGDKIPIVGGFNYARQKMPFQEKNTFVYTDNNGKVYTNVLEAKAIISAQPVSDSTGGWIMPLSRGPLPGEMMWLFLHGDKNIESETVDIQTEDPDANGYYNEEAGVVYFIPDVEGDFPESSIVNAVVYAEINSEKLDSAPAAGGKLKIRYETKEYKITVR